MLTDDGDTLGDLVTLAALLIEAGITPPAIKKTDIQAWTIEQTEIFYQFEEELRDCLRRKHTKYRNWGFHILWESDGRQYSMSQAFDRVNANRIRAIMPKSKDNLGQQSISTKDG